MSSLNKVQIIGNLGRDPELKTFSNGGKLCNLRIATNPVDSLSMDDRRTLGPAGVNALRSYADAVIQGNKPVTDDAVFVELTGLIAKAQMGGQAGQDARDKLKQINPIDYRMSLDDGDFQTFVAQQAAILNPAMKESDVPKAPAVSTLMSQIGPRLNAAGITNTGSKATPDKYAAIQAAMTRWAYANPEQSKDPVKVDQQATMLVTEIAYGGGWFSSATKKHLFELDFNGTTRTADDDLTVEKIDDAIENGSLSINGSKVPKAEAEGVKNLLVESLNGEQPTAEQFIQALTLYMQ